ncbi:Coactosin-like protein [Thelohanellus kitauei]|uniref:Coactosin-like protein n=1 Tax=Thelohanellus kitauei TaxID=669202 RepID=A0A0C2IQD6_THEKT|nr:Coactosin-like protein [Thelohanellus kitauei]
MVKLQVDEIMQAYDKVRLTDEIKWVAFGIRENPELIEVIDQGTEYEDFVKLCSDDASLFGFCSFNTGDELSVRKKFVLISWIGENVSGLKRGKCFTHRVEVQGLHLNAQVEVPAHAKEDIKASAILARLKAAGGANYGSSST